MKIRTTLTIKNIVVTATVLLIVFAVISVVSEHARSRAFFNDLKGEAITKANLFLEHRVDAATMQSIYLNNRAFINEVEVAVYTPAFEMLYHDAVSNDIVKESPSMMNEIVERGQIEFNVDDYQCVGLLYNYKGRDYVVTAAAYDGAGFANLHAQQRALVFLFLGGLVLLAPACYLMARSALRPMRQISREADRITGSEIDRRLPVRNAADEIGELSTTFNQLLDRLEQAFNSQRQFVSNVSHEMLTPLAAVMAQLDLALQKERTPDEYRRAIKAALTDARGMNSLIDGLLNLAKTDYRPEEIKREPLRLDELLLDVRQRILTAHPDYCINLIFNIETDSDDSAVTVDGNHYLLSVAFANLIENNCKYSADHTSLIQISHWQSDAIVRFSDAGEGISEADRERLFTLFYRGANTEGIQGHGIGMTLAQKIVALHGGRLTVHSHPGEGTTFVVTLPQAKGL